MKQIRELIRHFKAWKQKKRLRRAWGCDYIQCQNCPFFGVKMTGVQIDHFYCRRNLW